MSGPVFTMYCSPPTSCRKKDGFFKGSPSAVTCFPVTIGVGHTEAFSILNFLTKSDMYLLCLEYIPLSYRENDVGFKIF